MLVRHLRVHADQLRMIERRDEAEVRAGRRHVDVAARLVRLGLQREAEAVLLVDRVLAEVVDRLAQPLDRFVRAPAGVGLGPFAAAPQHEDLRAELGAEVHRAQRLLDRVGAHARVVGRERAVAEDRVVEQVDRRHRDDDAVLGAGAPGSRLTMRSRSAGVASIGTRSLSWRLTPHAPTSPSIADRIDRRQRRADHVAEGVAPAVADGPEAEGKLVFGSGIVGVRHRGGPAREPSRQIKSHSPIVRHTVPNRCPGSVGCGARRPTEAQPRVGGLSRLRRLRAAKLAAEQSRGPRTRLSGSRPRTPGRSAHWRWPS